MFSSEIPIFRKSISGSLHPTCTDQGKQETRHKAYNGNTTPCPLLLDSVSLYVFVLLACCVLRGIPGPPRKWVCLVCLAGSSSAAFVELTGVTASSHSIWAALPGLTLCWGLGQNVSTHKQMGLFLDSITVCLFASHCRLLCCLNSKYLRLNLSIPKTGDRSPTQNQLCPVFMTAFGPCMLIFHV